MYLLTTKPVTAKGSLFNPASKRTAVRPCCSGAALATSSPRHGSLESERESWAASVRCFSQTAESVKSSATPPDMPQLSSDRTASCRELTGRKKHRIWEPQLLYPPAALGDVSVVLLSPKRPSSVGAVARAASSFECEDLRIVSPRCDHLARSARNGSKGAQYLLWRAQLFEGLGQATAGAAITVAFTRWIQGRDRAFQSPAELFAAPELHHLVQADVEADGQAQPGEVASAACQRRIMLVFGREESGLTEAELAACDYVCSIPIGRLQESLSLSHAVSVVLSQIYQLRLNQSGLVPASVEELAAGYPQNESNDD